MPRKILTIISIILGVAAILGGGWKFYDAKADKIVVNKLSENKADQAIVDQLASNFYIYKLEQYRRYLQQRIWDIQKQYPSNYVNNSEYKQLVEELRQLDMKISAYYNKKGK